MSQVPRLDKMASGHHALILESNVSASDFHDLAQKWIKTLKLKLRDKASGGDEIAWTCYKNKSKFWLSWDIWFTNISLEPQNTNSAKTVREIGVSLGITNLKDE